MPKPTDRFYLLPLGPRHALWGDIGHNLQIAGIVLQGTGESIILMTPDAQSLLGTPHYIQMTTTEWSDFIQHSDDPSIFELDPTGGVKAVHRKIRYQISGAIQQKIWARDKFQCMYCKRQMGKVQLTIDHWIPLELHGQNNPYNYLSACRKCNKRKGNLPPKDWCQQTYGDLAHDTYNRLAAYLIEEGMRDMQ